MQMPKNTMSCTALPACPASTPAAWSKSDVKDWKDDTLQIRDHRSAMTLPHCSRAAPRTPRVLGF